VGKGVISGFSSAIVQGKHVLQSQVIEMHAGLSTSPVWNIRWKHSIHENAKVMLYGRITAPTYSEETMLHAIQDLLGVDKLYVSLYTLTPDWRGLNQA